MLYYERVHMYVCMHIESNPDTVPLSIHCKSLGLREFKQNKPWFDEECLSFLHQRKWAKMQWIQDPSQSNVDSLDNVRREVSRHFRNKKKAYLRGEIEELETNSKIQNVRDLYRGISDFKKGTSLDVI